MYQVEFINNGVSIIVHYPSSRNDDPHLQGISLKESLSSFSTLDFTIFINNPGYSILTEFKTKVKVTNLKDKTVRFIGRVYSIKESMNENGLVSKQVNCEGAMAYLNDTLQRYNTYTATKASDMLNKVLTFHNNHVESDKRIYVGRVDVTSQNGFTHTCDFKNTYNELLEIRNKYGGELDVRLGNDGKLYMDWILTPAPNAVEVMLGVNMKNMIIDKDMSQMGTRIVPLGANNLTISSVNSGKDYIEDTNARNIYGIIEFPVSYSDIEDAKELFNTARKEYKKYTQPGYQLSVTALDLAHITGRDIETFTKGTLLHIVNPLFGVDDIYQITDLSMNLETYYAPTLTISNSAFSYIQTQTQSVATSLKNNGVYNHVQIGDDYGIRCVRSDDKNVIEINALEGISISKEGDKVFFADTDGNLVVINVKAQGGEFDKITCTNGLTITDQSTQAIVNADGFKMIGQNGKLCHIGIIDNEDEHGTYIYNSLYVEQNIKLSGALYANMGIVAKDSCIFEGEVWFDENINIGNKSLKEYIKSVVGE